MYREVAEVSVLISLLAVFAMACVIWLAYGWMLLPGACPLSVVVTATGGGEGVEQTVKGLLWLKKNRLWSGTISIRDGGLNREGLMLVLTIARQEGVEFAGRILET